MTPQFRAAITAYGPRYMRDLGLTRLQAAGMFGNWAVESDQYRALQEYRPVVAGSRGGWGPPQWTGPRRVAFERWADLHGYRKDDPEAFYGYTLVELRGSEARALRGLRAMTTLDSATEAFMRLYERPGVPHLDRRKALALEALRELDVVLGGAPAALAPAIQTPAPISAPRAQTVSPPVVTTVPWWQRLVGIKPPAVVRPGLDPRGSAELYDIQKQLRALNFYDLKWEIDGLDGNGTQSAVAQSRKENGLGDGGMDAAFLAKLPTMQPRVVTAKRANIGFFDALKQRSDLSGPILKNLAVGGLTGAAGLAHEGGLFDQISAFAQKGNDVADKIQGGIGTAERVVVFAYQWKGPLIGIGIVGAVLYLIIPGIRQILGLWNDIKQARR